MPAVTLTCCDLDLQDITKIKKPVWQMFPSTHLPSFIQISPAVSEKQVRDARTHARAHARPHGRTRVKRQLNNARLSTSMQIRSFVFINCTGL
jgi:hypothetical protein